VSVIGPLICLTVFTAVADSCRFYASDVTRVRTAVVPFVTADDLVTIFSRVMMSYAAEKGNISAPNTLISTDYDISLSTLCLFDALFPEARQIFSILCIFMSL